MEKYKSERSSRSIWQRRSGNQIFKESWKHCIHLWVNTPRNGKELIPKGPCDGISVMRKRGEYEEDSTREMRKNEVEGRWARTVYIDIHSRVSISIVHRAGAQYFIKDSFLPGPSHVSSNWKWERAAREESATEIRGVSSELLTFWTISVIEEKLDTCVLDIINMIRIFADLIFEPKIAMRGVKAGRNATISLGCRRARGDYTVPVGFKKHTHTYVRSARKILDALIGLYVHILFTRQFSEDKLPSMKMCKYDRATCAKIVRKKW